MSDRTIVLWMIAAFAWVTPVAAQPAAPTTTAFDGTYAGVSRTFEGEINAVTRGAGSIPPACVPNGQPGPLVIAGGVARYNGSALGRVTWEGSVNAQGVLVMHDPHGSRIDAQNDGRGTVTGRATSGCSYYMVWQKEGK